MVFTIGILAIVLAMAVPAYSHWQSRSAVVDAAHALLAHMKQARLLALAENRSVSITFTATSYTFDVDTAGNCALCRKQAVDLGQFSKQLTLSPTTTRTFTSRGTISQSGTVTITAGAYSKKIVLNVIGRAYLQ